MHGQSFLRLEEVAFHEKPIETRDDPEIVIRALKVVLSYDSLRADRADKDLHESSGRHVFRKI